MFTITQTDLATRLWQSLFSRMYPWLLPPKDYWWTLRNGLPGSKALCVLLKGFLQSLTPNIIGWFQSQSLHLWATNDCFSCEPLRLLSWVFCGDRLTETNNWRLLLLQILAASVVSLLRRSPDEQLTIAFAADPCGFFRQSFAVIAWRNIDGCFCCESLRLLSWAFSVIASL